MGDRADGQVKDGFQAGVLPSQNAVLSQEEIRRVMSALGKIGGKIGGKTRDMALYSEKKTEIAKNSAAASWAKK